jgi:hypothetical protein
MTDKEDLSGWSQRCCDAFEVRVFKAICFVTMAGLLLANVMVHMLGSRPCNNFGLVASVCISCPNASFSVCYCCYDEFSGDVHVLSPYASRLVLCEKVC